MQVTSSLLQDSYRDADVSETPLRELRLRKMFSEQDGV